MKNPLQDQNEVDRATSQELTVRIFSGFLHTVFVAGVLCVAALLIGFVISVVFEKGTYPIGNCPDYPACSYE